jgi:hypothetical protein
MNRVRLLPIAVGIAATFVFGCDGQQYVSPDTVALVVSDDATSTERVHRCHYIPILLGSRVSVRYRVDDELKVNIDVTRDEVSVFFEGESAPVDVFRVESALFEAGARELDPTPPDGYTVELLSPCTPDDR